MIITWLVILTVWLLFLSLSVKDWADHMHYMNNVFLNMLDKLITQVHNKVDK
jgi:hypothetical protein